MASKAERSAPRMRFAPESQRALGRGIALLEQTLGPTIGPRGRLVAVGRVGRSGAVPELLDDGGTIARRMIGHPDRFENMGFLLARQAAWTMKAEVGDGASTAVVIMAAAYRALERLASAGHNRVELRNGLERAMAYALNSIEEATREFSIADVEAFACARGFDSEIAGRIGQALEAMGPDVHIDVRKSFNGSTRLELVQGALWESTNLISPLHDHVHDNSRISLTPARIMLWDAEMSNLEDAVRLLTRLQGHGVATCAIVARRFVPAVVALFRQAVLQNFTIVPVIAPQSGAQQQEMFGDLQALTGAPVLSPEAGNLVYSIKDTELGTSPQIVIGAKFMNVAATDRSEEIQLRQRTVRCQLTSATNDEALNRLRLRLARLEQKLAVVWVGAPSTAERDAKAMAARQSADEIRSAIQGGVVPGGGAMLLSVSHHLEEIARRENSPGMRAAADGLAAPARWVARNAGLEPSTVLHRLKGSGPCHGFDARRREVVDVCEAGILDSASTLHMAVRTGLSMAIQAIDCDALVLRNVKLSQAALTP